MADGAFFRDLALLLGAAVAGGALAQALRQPAFVGYILGGLLLGTLAGPAVAETGTFRLFAELGVVLLMLALGIEFSLRELWRVRALALVGAPVGVAAVVALFALLGRAAAVLLPFFLLASRLVPALLGRIAHAHNPELLVLVAVAIGVGTAALSAGLGLSLALGAFLAGLVISESEYTAEALARVLPLRDLFVAVFFVSVGTLIDPSTLAVRPGLLLQMLAVVLVGKAVIWAAVTLAFRSPPPVALAVGLGQTQIGEFSFVIAQLGRTTGLLSPEAYSAVLATSLITLLVNALVFRRSRPLERWADRWAPPAEAAADRAAPSVVVVGYGRVGAAIGEALETFAMPFTVVDLGPAVVRALRDRGLPAVLGDAANELALRRAGAAEARLAVLARAHSREEREMLLAAGATEVILPEVEAGLTLVDHALHRLAVPSHDVRAYLRRLREVEQPGARSAEGVPGATLPQSAVVEIVEGPLAHQSLRRSRIRERTGVTVVGIERSGEDSHWNPPPDAVLLPGDRVTVVGLLDQIARFRRLNAGVEH